MKSESDQEMKNSLTVGQALSLVAAPSDDQQCIEGMKILSQVTFNNAEAKLEAARLGGIPAIVSCLTNYSESSEVQEHGIKALRNMVFKIIESRREALGCGAIDALALALEKFVDNEAVCIEVVWALVVLCGNDEEPTRLAAEKTKDLLVQVNERHSHCNAITSKIMFLNASFQI
mmetsp:Transcript_15897/g.21023  ORF Transcript_15897/g.21023 Transcript_15897/m.21023 type:complete len:175 (+) Transcript_15897:75-599(+)